MKEYKNERFTMYLLIATLGFYFFLPPMVVALFCQWFNLNPFNVIRFWHINPFSAERGIPLYQTFIYILILWGAANILLGAILLVVSRLHKWFIKRPRWALLPLDEQKEVDWNSALKDNDSRYHLWVPVERKRFVSLCALPNWHDIAYIYSCLLASLVLAFFIVIFQSTNSLFSPGFICRADCFACL